MSHTYESYSISVLSKFCSRSTICFSVACQSVFSNRHFISSYRSHTVRLQILEYGQDFRFENFPHQPNLVGPVWKSRDSNVRRFRILIGAVRVIATINVVIILIAQKLPRLGPFQAWSYDSSKRIYPLL